MTARSEASRQKRIKTSIFLTQRFASRFYLRPSFFGHFKMANFLVDKAAKIKSKNDEKDTLISIQESLCFRKSKFSHAEVFFLFSCFFYLASENFLSANIRKYLPENHFLVFHGFQRRNHHRSIAPFFAI